MKVKGQERRVESQTASVGLRSLSGPRPSTLDPRLSRSGVTLVELLITMLIISILAALVLGVAAVAGQTAKEAHTRHMVARLHTLVMEQYDTYKNRRISLRPEVTNAINSLNADSTVKRKMLAESRLYALRELMMMEMPDRWSDILFGPVDSSNASSSVSKFPIYLDLSGSSIGRSPLGSNYWRRFNQYAKNATNPDDVERLMRNQDAECLYMFVMLATGDGEARSLFGESDIGDTDEDGAPEFLDGWKHPIGFLRWAPGFNSQIQNNANELGLPTGAIWTQAASNDHDPFDLYRMDPIAFRSVPLIFSRGRDDSIGIRTASQHIAWTGNNSANAAFNTSNAPKLFPYDEADDPSDGSKAYLGTTIDETATDNVHNHLLGQR